MNRPEPTAARADNLVLIGPMGAGKSSVARELSRLTQRRWVDTDRLVVREAGMPITEIFAAQGEEGFRRLETDALRSLVGQGRLIVATGGGIVTRPENMPLLRALGCVAWLTANEDVLFERVSRNDRRPLLQTDDPRATLHGLLERRRPFYESCAHVTVDTSVGTHAEIATLVLGQVRAFFAAVDPVRA